MAIQQLSEYRGMKPGDIISTYNNGFHKLLRIEDWPGYGTIQFIYHQVATNEGKLKNIKTERGCGADWCKPANDVVVKTIEDVKKTIIQLEEFQKLLNSGKVG